MANYMRKMKPAPKPQFVHNGVDILVSTDGKFCAHVNGIEVRTTTLDGMHARIEKVKPFEPFDSLSWKTYGTSTELTTRKIVGTKKTTGRYSRASLSWLDSHGGTLGRVLRATPQNRLTVETFLRMRKDARTKIEALEKQIETAEEGIDALYESVPQPQLAKV